MGLLLGVAALLIAIAAGANAALGGGGEAPPAKSLPQAIHDALAAPKVDGVTARVKLTSDLFGGMTTDQSSALLKGGSGRLWAAPGKLRVELQSDNGDAQIVWANGKGYVYDGPSDTAYTFAASGSHRRTSGTHPDAIPTIAKIEQRIAKAEQHSSIAGPEPAVVGGQPAYRVRITPKDGGGQVGGAQLAWDAARGVPLDVAIYARGASSPAVELAVTDISYGAVAPGVFDVSPPAGAKVVDMGGGSGGSGAAKNVAPSFKAMAPGTLGTRSRRDLKQAGDGYVALYGRGLDTIAVFEHPAAKHADVAPARGDQQGPVQLPTVKIGGARATAFGTPLGGVVSFERDGISYVVAGSQPLSVLEGAASGL